MGAEIFGLAFDALDPEAQARFWAGVLERDVAEGKPTWLLPSNEHEFPIYFEKTDVPKPGPNKMHFDLMTSSWDDQTETVERALALGGAHLDVGQLPEELHVVLQDPEGNEFCVIEPTNNFLKDTARIGAFSCDGSQAVGYFWAEALGWPLVWDQDEETAIQSPHGGSKISWGGPPFDPKLGKVRLHFDVIGDDQQAEVDRLIGLGAQHVDIGQGDDVPWVVLADPDGNEFCVLPPSFR
jgi:predicted enzyme related to lactoylglutathione lyase